MDAAVIVYLTNLKLTHDVLKSYINQPVDLQSPTLVVA